MPNEEITIGELYRSLLKAEADIRHLTEQQRAREDLETAFRHNLRNEFSGHLDGVRTTVYLQGQQVGRLEERLAVVSGMGGKSLSRVVTAALGLVMGLLGAWLTKGH